MKSTRQLVSRSCAVVLILLALGYVAAPTPADASTAGAGATVASATATAPVVGWSNDAQGNRTRLIQVTCVIGVIGIFLLTRTYR